jgi:drug/metabolite transporter (DMT)-like permease
MRPNVMTTFAFLGIVLFGGFNGIAIKYQLRELAPFWSDALRLLLSAAIFIAVLRWRRVPLPHGRALAGSVIYGLLNFATFMSLMYWSLQTTAPGFAMVILAIVPLLTLLLAAAHRLERLRPVSVIGAVCALAGIALIASERLGNGSGTVEGVIAISAGAVAMAETNVVVKLFPRAQPVANNAIAMSIGAVAVLVISFVAGESWVVPVEPVTYASLAYVALFGTVALFWFFLIVIDRWSASATSYALLLMPVVAVVGSALLLGEAITPLFVLGSAVVVAGVYLGAFGPSLARPLPGLFHRPQPAMVTAAADDGPPSLISPSCP